MVEEAGESGAVADTYGGRVHVEWDPTAAATPLGQLPFFAEFLKQSGGLLHCVRPLLSEPWKLDVDTTVKPLYGHQEGAEVGYNPGKRGRPSHSLHTYLMASVRLVLEVAPRSGKQNGCRHSRPALWRLLDRLGRSAWPSLIRGDSNWGSEPVMQRCEQEGLPYLLRLRQTANVKRALERALSDRDWTYAGHGWQGKEAELRLIGWSRSRRVILLRRRLRGTVELADRPGKDA